MHTCTLPQNFCNAMKHYLPSCFWAFGVPPASYLYSLVSSHTTWIPTKTQLFNASNCFLFFFVLSHLLRPPDCVTLENCFPCFFKCCGRLACKSSEQTRSDMRLFYFVACPNDRHLFPVIKWAMLGYETNTFS